MGGKNITFASLGNVILEPNTKVNAKAQERIYLKPGFHAKAGSYFRARIDPFCGNLRIGKDSVENETENLIEEERTKTDNNNILINPNPSTGLFTIEGEEPINPQQIEVYDIFGKRVQPIINQKANALTLNLSGYAKGMYFIKIGTYSQKVMVE
ncbi:MAG: T9SS type A sorting domain-containing protein [Flavobacteriales bacterium]|nr:T9SS type A sorting domain-containing protein [Flavobacteriales bacterium]